MDKNIKNNGHKDEVLYSMLSFFLYPHKTVQTTLTFTSIPVDNLSIKSNKFKMYGYLDFY